MFFIGFALVGCALDEESFSATYAETWCAAYVEDCPASEVSYFSFESVADCSSVVIGLSGGSDCAYDRVAGKTCLKAVRKASCEDVRDDQVAECSLDAIWGSACAAATDTGL